MNQDLQKIIDTIQQSQHLSDEEKSVILKSAKDADKALEISNFKLDRTEKVKRTTAILLEETIAELEQKRKAVEEQNKELEVEGALERVRTVAMSMNKPDDLFNICEILFHELQKLGFTELRNTLINILDDNKGSFLNYDYSEELGKSGTTVFYNAHPFIGKQLEQIRSAKDAFSETILTGQELKEWIETRRKNGEKDDPRLENAQSLNYYFYSIGTGAIGISTLSSIGESKLALLKRFRNVFNLSYQRYIDITNAEAQARESQIQLALERVRARTMAMHNSNELGEVAGLLFEQVKLLGVENYASGFNIWDKEQKNLISWMSNPTGSINPPFEMPIHSYSQHDKIFKAWKNQEIFLEDDLVGTSLTSHYKFLRSFLLLDASFKKSEAAGIETPDRQVHNNAFFSKGYLLFITHEPCPQFRDIFIRFAKVFEQTYTRFLDLQKAEAQAREAKIEASLEKVRSRTLAMQHSEELSETSAVLFQQLISLGISPNRLYICIVNGNNGDAEFWITDEDGSKVSMAYQDNLNNNPSFKKMLDGWQQKRQSQVIDMKGEELEQYFKYLNSIHVPFKGGLAQRRRIQYLAYFSKGFIGMASPGEQPEETIQLLERFAGVFNLTFTRFNDLKQAEAHALQAEQDLIEIKAARKKAEEALSELQATQKQLIQSEKMASLGELTAGIAHEIQNPLNFVNNFSEVSTELIDEMNEEITKGNLEDAKEIANDLKQNLEKINHHGKRAGDIVKGMLQHSRTSTGQKELTDINALCDEYLRLAYHGLRAKDKSFNAAMKTEYDDSIGLVKLIPQDIGRVLLNLINNAFYACTERSRSAVNVKATLQQATLRQAQGDSHFEPTVSISTKKINDKPDSYRVEIRVNDNGNGIPENIKDKIFQPFFTTKPTGQGTGLGLSLSYDIVKAHGGEIKLETVAGEGSEFIISLPVG